MRVSRVVCVVRRCTRIQEDNLTAGKDKVTSGSEPGSLHAPSNLLAAFHMLSCIAPSRVIYGWRGLGHYQTLRKGRDDPNEIYLRLRRWQ